MVSETKPDALSYLYFSEAFFLPSISHFIQIFFMIRDSFSFCLDIIFDAYSELSSVLVYQIGISDMD